MMMNVMYVMMMKYVDIFMRRGRYHFWIDSVYTHTKDGQLNLSTLYDRHSPGLQLDDFVRIKLCITICVVINSQLLQTLKTNLHVTPPDKTHSLLHNALMLPCWWGSSGWRAIYVQLSKPIGHASELSGVFKQHATAQSRVSASQLLEVSRWTWVGVNRVLRFHSFTLCYTAVYV